MLPYGMSTDKAGVLFAWGLREMRMENISWKVISLGVKGPPREPELQKGRKWNWDGGQGLGPSGTAG